MGRVGIIALAASLAVNVFLGGFVAGRMLGPSDQRSGAERFTQQALTGEYAETSPATRAAFRKAYADRREEMRLGRAEARAARLAFLEAAGSDQWDRAAVEAALENVKTIERKRETARSALLLDALESMQADERKAWVARSVARMKNGRSGDGRFGAQREGGRRRDRPATEPVEAAPPPRPND